ncbi:MAG: hypothetical protein V1754_03890, partial [Pseudomonadota bacterium]
LVVAGYPPILIDEIIAAAIMHPDCKTVSAGRSHFDHERERFFDIYAEYLTTEDLRRCRFLQNMRKLIFAIREQGPLQAVPSGFKIVTRHPLLFTRLLWTKLRDDWPWVTMERIEGEEAERLARRFLPKT